VIALLPAHPNNGADDSRGQVGLLIDADEKSGDDTTRFLACSLYQPGRAGKSVYVHSKTAVIDDTWLTVGSANLNEHSLFNDSEVNVVVRDRALAREVRLRLWEEHLERPREEIDDNTARVFDEVWRPLAEERLEQRRRDGWADGKLTLLPHVSRRAEALWGPLNGLVVDGWLVGARFEKLRFSNRLEVLRQPVSVVSGWLRACFCLSILWREAAVVRSRAAEAGASAVRPAAKSPLARLVWLPAFCA
jgi:hypothetical protein